MSPFTQKNVGRTGDEYRVIFCDEERWLDLTVEFERQLRKDLGKDFIEEVYGNLTYYHASGISYPNGRVVLINNASIREDSFYDVANDIFIGQIASHELGHVFGLWHSGSYAKHLVPGWIFQYNEYGNPIQVPGYRYRVNRLVPPRINADLPHGEVSLDNLMGIVGVHPRKEPANALDMGVSEFQRRQVRSFLKGGVAFREYEETRFDLYRLMSKVHQYELHTSYQEVQELKSSVGKK